MNKYIEELTRGMCHTFEVKTINQRVELKEGRPNLVEITFTHSGKDSHEKARKFVKDIWDWTVKGHEQGKVIQVFTLKMNK